MPCIDVVRQVKLDRPYQGARQRHATQKTGIMKHSLPTRRNPFDMLETALQNGWQSVATLPVRGEGEFLVLTLSGLIRRARNRNTVRKFRRADGYGPARANVIGCETGNYLAAIAWKRAE